MPAPVLLLTVIGCGEENSSGFVRPPSVSLNAGALAAGSVSGPAAFLRKLTCAIGAPRIRGGEQDCRQCPDVTHSAIASGRVLGRSRAVINTLLRSQLREEISRAFTARIASEFSRTDAGLIDDASAYFRARSLTSSDQRAWAAGTTKNAWRHPL
jgi:hypothetical protein